LIGLEGFKEKVMRLVHRITAAAGFSGLVFGTVALLGAAGAASLRTVGPSGSPAGPQAASEEIVWKPVPGPGKKCPIDDVHYFKYAFNEKPKMGMAILKIQVFDKKGGQVVPFLIIGRTDMPSMRGAHNSGDVEFKLSRKNDYLLPINVVMPGDWEVRVTFKLNDKAVFYGSIRFDV
jgi:hypothetical protein